MTPRVLGYIIPIVRSMQTVAQQQPPNTGKRRASEGWLHIRLDRELRKALNIRAAEQDMSLAEACREAVRMYLGKAA